MTPAWSAILASALILGAASTEVRAQDCPASYQETYAEDWQTSRDQWAQICAQFPRPNDALNEAQRRSMQACTSRYGSAAAGKSLDQSTVIAYCAQGARGRQWLDGTLGLPASQAPAAAAVAPASQAAVFSAGTILYDSLRAERPSDFVCRGRNDGWQGCPPSDRLLKHWWTTRCSVNINVHDDIAVPLCTVGYPNASLTLLRSKQRDLWRRRMGTEQMPSISDHGCTGLLKDIHVIWGADPDPDKPFPPITQKELDFYFHVIVDFLQHNCGTDP